MDISGILMDINGIRMDINGYWWYIDGYIYMDTYGYERILMVTNGY